MASNRPIPIVRETKEQFAPVPIPKEKKWTYQNANEDKDKINAAINFLPIFLNTGDDGILTGYTILVDETMVNVLDNIHIGAIFQLGTGVSYSEYDPEFGSVEWDEFSKQISQTTIMQAGTNIPKVFSPKSKYILFPR